MALKVMLAAVEGEVRLKFVYNDFNEVKAFTPKMKKALRKGTYRWNPKVNQKTGRPNPGGDNSWYILSSEIDRLEELAEQLGVEVEVYDLGGPPPEEPSLDGRDAFRLMFGKVPTKTLKKVYLALMRAFHPDKAGMDEALGERYNKLAQSISEGWAAVQIEREEARAAREDLS